MIEVASSREIRITHAALHDVALVAQVRERLAPHIAGVSARGAIACACQLAKLPRSNMVLESGYRGAGAAATSVQ
jgi:hypothetical protein